MLFRVPLSLLMLLLSLSCVRGAMITDDLTDGSFEPTFNYDFNQPLAGIQGIADTANDFTGSDDFASLSSPTGLFLAADRVGVTFNLSGGEFASDAMVVGEDFVDNAPAFITFLGVDANGNPIQRTEDVTDIAFTSTASLLGPFAQVDEIIIEGFETQVFSVGITAVPEPSIVPLGIALLGGLCAGRKRFRRQWSVIA